MRVPFMSLVLAAIFPIIALLLLGFWARHSGFLPAAFWPPAERATYYVLLPALLVLNLVQARLDWDSAGSLALAAALLPVLAALVSLPFRSLLSLSGPDFTSFFQSTVRFSTYLGLALATVFPEPAASLAAVVLAVMIPVVNILCVLAFSVYADRTLHWRQVLVSLATNPLILACLLGIVLHAFPPLPSLLLDLIKTLAQMALPMGLLAVGAGLNLAYLRGASRVLWWAAVLRLAVLPCLAWALGNSLGLEPVALQLLILFAALPTAPSAYVLARQLGGNAELMAGMITGQTLLALVTLPILLALWLS